LITQPPSALVAFSGSLPDQRSRMPMTRQTTISAICCMAGENPGSEGRDVEEATASRGELS